MKPEKKNNVRLILYDSYIQAIKNSIGSNLFKNLYATADGSVSKDILDNGRLSCAFFVSSLLYIFKLISDIHATVNGTIKDLEQFDWTEIEKPEIGAILIWETKMIRDESHRHIGFYMGNDLAISNNTSRHVPFLHHWTFGNENGKPVRKIEKIYWNNKLNKNG